jgi:hypothetical protein
MHFHLIVSRKDQSNKKKLSPLTNHRNTNKGVIKGGFDRKNLFQQAESGFDKLFGYQRDLQETFVYCNTMTNGSIDEKLEMQERCLSGETKMDFQREQNNLVQGYDEVGNVVSALGSLFPLDNQGDYDEGRAEYLRQHKKKRKDREISR